MCKAVLYASATANSPQVIVLNGQGGIVPVWPWVVASGSEGKARMIPNKKHVKCDRCGGSVEIEIVPDGFSDAPKAFTMTRTCDRSCPKEYLSMTADQMHEATGLPMSGWQG